MYDAWSDAHEDAEAAYWAWTASRGAEDYLVYRAAQDREDAAQDALAVAALTRSRPSRRRSCARSAR